MCVFPINTKVCLDPRMYSFVEWNIIRSIFISFKLAIKSSSKAVVVHCLVQMDRVIMVKYNVYNEIWIIHFTRFS